MLGDTCPYYSLVKSGQCTWLAPFYGMRESTLANLMFLDYHRSLYVPAECSTSMEFTTVRAAILARASFAFLDQRINGKERQRSCGSDQFTGFLIVVIGHFSLLGHLHYRFQSK